MDLTPLETAMLERVAAACWPGFELDAIEVTERENTGAGRYTTLRDRKAQPLTDGVYGPGAVHVEHDGFILQFVVFAKAGAIAFLEMFTIDDPWDGVERAWRMVDPTRSGR